MHGFAETRLVRATHRIRTQNAAEAHQTNLTAVSRLGTTVTASETIHQKGLYTELIASTAATGYGLWVALKDVSASSALRLLFLDIALGDAGSESVIIHNIDGGAASPFESSKLYYFPGLQIPQGSRISGRAQANVASLTVSVFVWVDYGAMFDVSNPSIVTYGADVVSTTGVSVIAGIGAFGSWAEIATTSRDHKIFSLGFNAGSDITLGDDFVAQLGYGPDAANVIPIGTFLFKEDASERICGPTPPFIVVPVASGQKIFVRTASSAANTRSAVVYAN